SVVCLFFFFFFQAEDGIRDLTVTGVQTCALPILIEHHRRPNPGLTPMMLNHAAWVTPDAAVTAEFYTRIMGMDLVSTVIEDTSPSTGLQIPYFHLFFRMADGSTLAFFEAPGVLPPAKSS